MPRTDCQRAQRQHGRNPLAAHRVDRSREVVSRHRLAGGLAQQPSPEGLNLLQLQVCGRTREVAVRRRAGARAGIAGYPVEIFPVLLPASRLLDDGFMNAICLTSALPRLGTGFKPALSRLQGRRMRPPPLPLKLCCRKGSMTGSDQQLAEEEHGQERDWPTDGATDCGSHGAAAHWRTCAHAGDGRDR